MTDQPAGAEKQAPTSESGYEVDRVVVCDAFAEPNQHYRLLPGGKSKLIAGRRPSMRYLASAKAAKGGMAGIMGKQTSLLEDLLASGAQLNDTVNELREQVRVWRSNGYPDTSLTTGRLLEWWFERDDERAAQGKRFFFCQQEAIETVIYLYEARKKQQMPET
jgi:type III restriction enzyme